MFEDGVGDLAAAMDHLQLALDEPPAATFRPVLRALRLHAVEAGSSWTAIDLLDIEMAAAGTVAAQADLAVEKAGLLEHPLLVARSGPRRAGRGAVAGARAIRRRCWRWRRARSGRPTPRCCSRCSNGGWPRPASAGERGRLLCRLALLAEASPDRTADALDLWLRALDEEAGAGAAALARAGRGGSPPVSARTRSWRAPWSWRRKRPAGPERAAWLGLGAALAQHRLGAVGARGRADRGGARRRSR